MIRRRCRYILVVDADADEKFDFQDLARSVRFAAIDLDAKIEFVSIEMKPAREATKTSATFAVGKVTYAESPDDQSWLIYLKPTYFYERAPIDVRSYGAINSTFPHETTLDQWFGEAQFESYRRLGEYLMGKLYENIFQKKSQRLPRKARESTRSSSSSPRLCRNTARFYSNSQVICSATICHPRSNEGPLKFRLSER